MSDTLFPLPPGEPAAAVPPGEPRGGEPRLERAERHQLRFEPQRLDDLVPADHVVRAVWKYVESLPLAPLYTEVLAVEGQAGRPAIDPKLLVALWLYATVQGVGSARELATLTVEHNAYRWLCGGVSVCYHTLSDFRTAHAAWCDQMLTQSVAVLVHAQVVDLKRIAEDGLRVRASAGASSFRRRATLEGCLAEAQAQVAELKREVEAHPEAAGTKSAKARERAAREREERVRQALQELPKIEAAKKEQDRGTARVSSSDPQARVMKMADGGFRPAYNVQLAASTAGQAIVAVSVTNSGSDMGQMPAMVQQVEERFETTPQEWLVDGGHAKKEDIEAVSQKGTTVYAPVQKPKKEDVDPHQPRATDSEAIAAWRQRMGTPAAKEIYKDRAATIECVNAQARQRELTHVTVRGTVKVLAVVLWYALAHNLMRALALGVLACSGP
jgi:transposase